MERLERGISSPRNPPNPSSPGVTNENDVSHNQMDSISMSQKTKKSVTKHFMSPTISAKSKVTAPRKKILAEKNEPLSSENAHKAQMFPILDSKSGLQRTLESDVDNVTTFSADSTVKPYDSFTNYLSPRPKILAEKNEPLSSENAHKAQKFPNLDSKSGLQRTLESDDDSVTTFSADSTVKPYDPFTNYLSPRPKYLRYKKNKRHQILHDRDSGRVREDDSFLQTSGISNSSNKKFVEEEKSSEFVLEEPLISSPHEGSSGGLMVKAEDENNYHGEDTDDEEGEGEEFVDERSWSLKRLLKFLLLFIVIAWSIPYISTINSPTPSPVGESVGGLTDGFEIMYTHLSEAVSSNVQSGIWVNGSSGVRKLNAQTGFLEGNNEPFGNEIVRMTEPCHELNEVSSDQDDVEGHLNWSDWETAFYRDLDVDKELPDDQFSVLESAEADQFSSSTDEEPKKIEDDGSEGQYQDATLDDTQSPSGCEHVGHITEGNRLKNNDNTDEFEGSFGETEGEEMAVIGSDDTAADTTSRYLEDETCPEAGEGVRGIAEEKSIESLSETEWQTFETAAECVDDDTSRYMEDETCPEAVDTFGRYTEDETCPEAEEEVKGITEEKSRENLLETEWQTFETAVEFVGDVDTELLDARRIEKGIVPMEVAKFMDLGPISIASISLFLVVIIFASLVYIYSAGDGTRHEESDKKDKNSAQPFMEFKHMQEKAESIRIPSSVNFPFEETTREHTRCHAPNVELLGDFVIGECSSSLRSSGRNGGMMTETTEESTGHPTSHVAHVNSQPRQVSIDRSPNVSTADSSSYGSFTTDKIILRKEWGGDGDAKLITTPVRRSSRIRNLTMTPTS